MAVTIIQTGTSLQLMDEAGDLTALTLPTGVTLATNVKPRWCAINNNVVLVNTPSQPLTIDATGTVRLLTPKPPRLAPIIAGVAGGTLTGTYRVKETFVTLDSFGNTLSESDYSPVSASVAIAAKFLGVSNADVSPDNITLRRFYRTTTLGAVYFQWIDLDGNVITTIQDDLADAGLSIFSAPILGTPPRLTTIAEFRGRLFGTGDTDIDHLRYTETGVQYAWPADNLIEIPPVGSDSFGVVALVPRREALGVGRRNSLAQITGTGAEDATGAPNFNVVILSKELGVESQETVCVFRDTAYFLWKDGLYRWNSSGIACVSDGMNGKGEVRSWFTTDDYFNRDMFVNAFAHIDQDGPRYRLFLASAGSTTIDRWVEYDLSDGTWWGPHKTALFTPTSAFVRVDAENRDNPVIGGAVCVYEETETRTDGAAIAIEFDAIGKRHDMQVPDTDKYFGEISLLGKAQTSGTLAVTTIAGDLNATRSKVQRYDMRKTRQRLGRIGTGKHAQVQLTNAEVGVDVEVHGYEVNPVNELGRR